MDIYLRVEQLEIGGTKIKGDVDPQFFVFHEITKAVNINYLFSAVDINPVVGHVLVRKG